MTVMRPRSFGCFTTTLLIVSVLAVGGGIFFAYKTHLTWQNAKSATGVVIENVSELGDEQDELFRPKILFINAQGDSVIFSASFASSFHIFDVGDKVDVLYLVDKATTDTFAERWVGIIFLTMGGTCGLALAIFAMRLGTTESKRIDQLLKNGRQVKAKISLIETWPGTEDTYGSIVIFCEAEIDGSTQKFIADKMNRDSTSLKVGDEITVYHEHRNPKNYYVIIPAGK
jgi:hypothetical protein